MVGSRRFHFALHGLQGLANGAVIGVAILLSGATLAAALGYLPWPDLALSFGGKAVPAAGMWGQVGLTAVFVLLCLFIPANARMTRLERSHRSFAMGMEDVSRAYRMAHAADRAGVFALSAEFDSMRARIEHLRKHPDLAHLEPELLQLAAQMSFETRDLARAYSDDKVERARSFLRQRQQEVEALTERLSLARHTCDELRRWLTDVEAEERVVQQQAKRLEADLRELLPLLGYDFEELREPNVVSLPKPLK